MSVGIRARYIVLTPTVSAQVPSGSLFLDAANGNASTIKDASGRTMPINQSEAAQNLVTKKMQALSPMPSNTPVSKRPDGKIEMADANAPNGKDLIGVTLDTAANADDLVNVLCVGANLVGVLSGLGFIVGQEIYISPAGGYTNDPSTLQDADAVVKIGIADCAAGGASSVADDLVLFPDVVST